MSRLYRRSHRISLFCRGRPFLFLSLHRPSPSPRSYDFSPGQPFTKWDDSLHTLQGNGQYSSRRSRDPQFLHTGPGLRRSPCMEMRPAPGVRPVNLIVLQDDVFPGLVPSISLKTECKRRSKTCSHITTACNGSTILSRTSY